MNSITVAGQLGKDAEVRYLPAGDPVANFSIADSQGKDKDAIWWSCQLFGKRAETLAQYLVKGRAVIITGSVSQRKYTDKNGQERISTDVRVNDVALQGGRKESAPQAKQEKQSNTGRVENIGDDDIPF
ncbi:single strand binding protein [Caudoviricetes sp.]|nr:single strand binding protein [Caudoviricetes sp.]